MNAKSRDSELNAVESSNETGEAGEGSKRLRLSVQRMKKLRTHAKGGFEETPTDASTGKDW